MASFVDRSTGFVENIYPPIQIGIISYGQKLMDSVSFFGVNSTETYREFMKKYPNAQLILKDNYRNFIRFVASSKKKAEERYSNVAIWNDNTIATVSFNYSFWIDDKETNWGIETWQLLFNGKEWKIMSALFSYNDEHITPESAHR